MLQLNHIAVMLEKAHRIETHKHDFWEVIYYTEGSGFIEVVRKRLLLKKMMCLSFLPVLSILNILTPDLETIISHVRITVSPILRI